MRLTADRNHFMPGEKAATWAKDKSMGKICELMDRSFSVMKDEVKISRLLLALSILVSNAKYSEIFCLHFAPTPKI